MSLQWVTPLGTLGNALIGQPVSLSVFAYNMASPQAPVTYQVIGGTLPTGLSLSSTGVLTGTPAYADSADNYWSTKNYNFIIRATSGSAVLDGSFQIILSNTINGDFQWVTPAGNLGTIPTAQFCRFPLSVSATGHVTFKFISGELPSGVQISADGYIEGVPTLTTSTVVNQSQEYRFTVRATNAAGHINDRAFSLTVTNIYGPVIEPTTGATTILGTFFDGTFYNRQLYVNELGSNVSVTWSNIGSLPPGVTLSSDGVLSGYLQPLQLVGSYGPAGYDGDTVTDGIVTDEQEFDLGPYDFNQLNQTLSYSFTIQAYDGANYDLQNYVLNVVSRAGFTADNTEVTVDATGITVDSTNVYVPVILNANVSVLPSGRGGSFYAYKFEGYDFQGDTLTYNLSNTVGTFDADVADVDAGFDYGSTETTNTLSGASHLAGVTFDYASYIAETHGAATLPNLPGLSLDSSTGWLYGQLTEITSASDTYTFALQVSKTRGNVTYTSNPQYFSITVLGDINNVINWITPSNLGTINNGTVSDLAVKAVSLENKPLIYTLVDSPKVSARLPQGLTLLPSGELSGRVTFETFSIDGYTTTFDKNTTTIDKTCTFSVKVSTADGSASSVQEFTLRVNVIDKEPYESLYLQAMPTWDQRQIYNSIISNTEIFVPSLIYRPSDPWFGINQHITTLFLPGLNASTLNEYATAIMKNHWTKQYTFGKIKTAVVLDSTYNTKYEVVYIELIDPELNTNGNGPGLELNLTNAIANPYIDADNNSYKIIYPNTSVNMTTRLADTIGYYDQSSLPDWMTSNQPGTSTGSFNPPLGFTRAVVLAYTVPGASKLIAYRLQNSGINFNTVEFSVDRYLLDDHYSANFDVATKTFIPSKETTFDVLSGQNTGSIAAQVNYAVQVPFDQINGRPLSYLQTVGLDGDVNWRPGDTLVFAKQENFINPGPYGGWVDYTDAYIGDNILTTTHEGYDSESYDTYSVIPGYLEKSQGVAPVNQRGGIWQINVVNDVINLSFVREIDPNQKVRVLFGTTYGGAVLIYTLNLQAAQTVPYYAPFTSTVTTVSKRTTFNNDTTKFFSNRDTYYAPNTEDKYVKFPQYGVFT